MPNIPGFTPKFNKIARDLVTTSAKTALGDKNDNVVYNIPCKCNRYTYVGETERKWSTRKKEHQDKVRLTKEDIQKGSIERATTRMNDRDGGLARHATTCQREIDWDNAKIIGKEESWTQRKLLEGIETLRMKSQGMIVLNQYNQMDSWKGVLSSLFNNDDQPSDVR